jgi:hypothetical protein
MDSLNASHPAPGFPGIFLSERVKSLKYVLLEHVPFKKLPFNFIVIDALLHSDV